MKKIVNSGFLFLLIAVFLGCSGKVQTNPIPEPKKYSLPKIGWEDRLITEVPKKYIEDYDNYAKNFFKADPKEYKRSIWSIGLERGHYDN
ncbi:hypothetical protein [Campylobacter jejuni]|uniref:hypothetical protein n=1 Tax=Campylobacter jejuni TaxID=197 RepID=UPI0008930001|nr:hypothetical protein [Campylobacter jejuni]OEZ15048.1 hypothetical protein A0L49_08705 [Campylobacter jejuni]